MSFQDKYKKHLKEVEGLKAESTKILSELNGAHEYKESIIQKITFADKQITSKQQEYHNILVKTQGSISRLAAAFNDEISRLKEI